jgi:hypothetical protein
MGDEKLSREEEIAQSSSFLEFAEKFGNRALQEEDLYDTQDTLTDRPGGGVWLWKEGSELEQRYDVSPHYPIDNGGEPPYRRQSVGPSRQHIGLWFEYRENGGKGDFEPAPLPSPKRLKRIAARNRADLF